MIKIYGREEPRGEFIGYNSQWDHEIKWTRVLCDDPEIQAIIERDIHYTGYYVHDMYCNLFAYWPDNTLEISKQGFLDMVYNG